jgi:hypothetical protein
MNPVGNWDLSYCDWSHLRGTWFTGHFMAEHAGLVLTPLGLVFM